MTDPAMHVDSTAGDPPALARLRDSITRQRDLPATAYAPRRLSITAANLDVRIQELADLAFVDPAIVVRLLRIANSSSYETRDRTEVVAVQRAIALLGHDTVRVDVRKLPDFESRVPNEYRAMVRAEIAQTVFAAQVVYNLLDTRNPLVSDEGAVTVVISRLASILCAIVAPHEMCALRWVRQHHPHLHEAIERELFGRTEDQLNREIVEAWQLPRSVLATIGRARQRPQAVAQARDWLPLAVGLALEVAATPRIGARAARDDALMDIVGRYARHLDIDGPRLDGLLEESAVKAIRMERTLGCDAAELAIAPLLQPLMKRASHQEGWWPAMERLDITGVITRLKTQDRKPEFIVKASSTPRDAHVAEQQLATLHGDLCALIDAHGAFEADPRFQTSTDTPWERICTRIAPRLLDGIREIMRFQQTALFLRDRNDKPMVVASASPPMASAGAGVSVGVTSSAADLFSVAMGNRVDLHIEDCTIAKISRRLPAWFSMQFEHAHSFVLLPLANEQRSTGFILGIWHNAEPEGISKAELAQLQKIRDALFDAFERSSPVATEVI